MVLFYKKGLGTKNITHFMILIIYLNSAYSKVPYIKKLGKEIF